MPEIAPGIEVDPQRCHGKPVIKGTRVPVRTVLASLAAGDSVELITHSYQITAEDVRAAIRFANELVKDWDFHPARG